MVSSKFIVSGLLTIGLTACSGPLGPADMEALASAAPAILLEAAPQGLVPRAAWPAAILRLNPERVYATSDGLYVVTSSLFAEDQGFFVPRLPDFQAPSGTDPSYTSVGLGVFSFRIRG